jgi:Leucine-rich repeat (LRR) protein
LKSLDPLLFQNLTNLKNLKLESNQLANLDPSTFNGLTSLQTLTLSSNQLTSLDPSLFNNMKILNSLWLSSNNLTNLDPSIFGNIGNTNMINIYIDGNPVVFSGQSSAYFCNGNNLCQCYCYFNSTTKTFALCSGSLLN